MNAINFKVYPKNKSQIKAIKAVFKAFNVRFEVEEKEHYNQEFVSRVLSAKEEIEQGKGVKIATKDLWK
jgi:predicted RND superfamily exporter protein